MSVKVEKLEGSKALLTIECSEEEFAEATKKAYIKNKNKIQIQGFRKGKAPQAMIEKIYGPGVFYEDAANALIPEAYDKALSSDECKDLEIVAEPEIDVTQIEKGKPFIFTAEVVLRPEVELGKYKGFRIAKKKAEVTEEEIEEELNKVREENARTITIDDRAAEDGDIVNIDYQGFADGEAFEGGTSKGYELTLGSHSFIDTFEEQIVGKNIGDEFDVNVTFPKEYHADELAGKPAVFKVKLNSIKKKELPEADDEFASEVSDFETLSEYKEDLKKSIAGRKQTELDNKRRDDILKKAVDNAKMEIPEKMVEFQAKQLTRDYAQRMQMQGLSMEMYLQYTGQTMEQLVEGFKDQAKTRIQNSLVLEAIAKAENIEVSDDDVKAEMEKMAKNYQMELEKLEEYIGENEKESIRKDLAVQKAVELITK